MHLKFLPHHLNLIFKPSPARMCRAFSSQRLGTLTHLRVIWWKHLSSCADSAAFTIILKFFWTAHTHMQDLCHTSEMPLPHCWTDSHFQNVVVQYLFSVTSYHMSMPSPLGTSESHLNLIQHLQRTTLTSELFPKPNCDDSQQVAVKYVLSSKILRIKVLALVSGPIFQMHTAFHTTILSSSLVPSFSYVNCSFETHVVLQLLYPTIDGTFADLYAGVNLATSQ